MKKYFFMITVVLLTLVSCSKPKFNGAGNSRVTLSLASVNRTSATLVVTPNFSIQYYGSYSSGYYDLKIIDNKTGDLMGTTYYGNENGGNIVINGLTRNTTYTVHALVTENYNYSGYIRSDDFSFTTAR